MFKAALYHVNYSSFLNSKEVEFESIFNPTLNLSDRCL